MLLGKQLSAVVAGAVPNVPNHLFCLGQVVLRAGELGLWYWFSSVRLCWWRELRAERSNRFA